MTHKLPIILPQAIDEQVTVRVGRCEGMSVGGPLEIEHCPEPLALDRILEPRDERTPSNGD